jgi:hypothetical protein
MVFAAAINFTVNLATPFFAVYVLRGLGFNYVTYIVVNGCATRGNFLSLSFWGKLRHKCGKI